MIDINTKILGLIGYPLGHSISPLLHNHTINDMNELNYVYLPFQVEPEKFNNIINGIKAMKNLRGFNVTIPYKEKIISFLNNIDPLAARIGAVNTVVNVNGILTGYNTDLSGLIRMIRDDGNFEIKGKTVLIIGAGGAARAAGISVLSEGASRVYLLNRTTSKLDILYKEWEGYYPEIKVIVGPLEPDFYDSFINSVDLLIDTTPVGMSPNIDMFPVIRTNFLHSNMLVVDLVYNPKKTTLIKAADEVGAKTLNGMGMLLYQGIESFKIWTGYEIDPESWWRVVEDNVF